MELTETSELGSFKETDLFCVLRQFMTETCDCLCVCVCVLVGACMCVPCSSLDSNRDYSLALHCFDWPVPDRSRVNPKIVEQAQCLRITYHHFPFTLRDGAFDCTQSKT